MFIFALILIQGVLFLAHYLIYGTLIYFIAPTYFAVGAHLFWLRIIFILLSISFVVINLIAFNFYNKLISFIYKLTALWLGIVWFLTIGTLIIAIFQTTPLVSGIIFMIACLISLYSAINGFAIGVNSMTINLSNLSQEWKGKKSLVFSDAHLGNMRSEKYINRIAELILKRKPEIVFIVGDLFDGQPVDYYDIISPLKKLVDSVPWGIYFVTGNHEEFSDPEKYLRAIRAIGIKVLDNEVINIYGMNICGVDYKKTEGMEEFREVLREIMPDNIKSSPTILLKHVPSNLDIAESAGVSLSLHGHTHNGQLWPLGYVARGIYGKFYHGYSKLNNMQVFTSSGVGTWGPPHRFLTNSEIVEITFNQ